MTERDDNDRAPLAELELLAERVENGWMITCAVRHGERWQEKRYVAEGLADVRALGAWCWREALADEAAARAGGDEHEGDVP